ncbi:hypothetical protein GCM10023321_63980 [Pseudonocardia eucalypti]|uniref:HTH gntR-type domain-containing protein n=1 Tax=Pseudonocardia eucalypti TaxID=648755 RepID=A0ABP9QXZ5_9PSEU|nr:DNA-binding GntR family transcriptional regulator [Pseudonocardia eucalypti]
MGALPGANWPRGTRLSEDQACQLLGVSRSTLREAFRLLIQQRLLVHELSRGAFVRRLSPRDIAELFDTQRLIETATLRQVEYLDLDGLAELDDDVADGWAGVEAGRWDQIADANARFHDAVAFGFPQRGHHLVSRAWLLRLRRGALPRRGYCARGPRQVRPLRIGGHRWDISSDSNGTGIGSVVEVIPTLVGQCR